MTTRYEQEERIYYSATTFRRLLDSLARPGKLTTLEYPRFLGTPPDTSHTTSSTPLPLNFFALGALMTLLDKEVTFALGAHGVWLRPDITAAQWIALRSGARMAMPDSATFAFVCDSASSALLPQLNMGTLLEPERSTTAFCCIEHIADAQDDGESAEQWLRLSLSGPGIDGNRTIVVSQNAASLIATISATRKQYPSGLDVYLVDATGQCVGLPRTTHIQY